MHAHDSRATVLKPGLWMPWSKAEAVTAPMAGVLPQEGLPGTNQFLPVTSSVRRETWAQLRLWSQDTRKAPTSTHEGDTVRCSRSELPYLAPRDARQSTLGSVLPRGPGSCLLLGSLTATEQHLRTSNWVTNAPMFWENELPRVLRSES